MIIADETDAAARAKWEHYKAGTDQEAVAWLVQQSDADKASGGDTNVRQMVDPVSVVNINMGTLVGSYETVARLLDEVATVEGCDGVLLTFDDFIKSRFVPHVLEDASFESALAVFVFEELIQPWLFSAHGASDVVALVEQNVGNMRCDVAVGSCYKDPFALGDPPVCLRHWCV